MRMKSHPTAQRLLAAFLSIALAWTQVPVAALAEGTGQEAIVSASQTEDAGAGSAAGQSGADAATDTASTAESTASEAAAQGADTASGSAEDISPGTEATTTTSGQAATSTIAATETSTADDAQELSATISVIGPGSDGKDTEWLSATTVPMKEGSTAADLTESALKDAGLTADIQSTSYGAYLNSITSPVDGKAYAYNTNSDQKYWQLFVDGEASSSGMSGVPLTDGMSVVWYYSAYGASLPPQTLDVTISVIGPGADGSDSYWLDKKSVTIEDGKTAADLTTSAFKDAGLSADIQSSDYGAYLNSITSPKDGTAYAYNTNGDQRYWQLFVDGKASDSGMSDVPLRDGLSIVWYYPAYGASLPDTMELSVKISVLGPDAEGNVCNWLAEKTVRVKEGSTAADLTTSTFKDAGLSADTQSTSYGAYLNAITSPFDGKAYAYNENGDQKYWQLFVDGGASSSGMSGVTLSEGTSIVWYYSGWGDALPGEGQIVDDPSLEVPDASAKRTSEEVVWAGFNQGMEGGAVTAATPTSQAGTVLAWSPFRIGMGQSDPVLVGGKLYLVGEGVLHVVDAQTGTELASKRISTKTSYFCRPIYAEGLLIVPVDDGRLLAFTTYSADDPDNSLKLVWETPRIAVEGSTQALSSLSVAGGRVYAAFSVVDWLNPLNGTGILVSASLADGSSWQQVSERNEYYWAGAATAGSDIVVADEQGFIRLIDGTDGEEIGSLDLGCASHAGVTKVSDTSFAAVTTDGVLHLVSLEGTTLKEAGKVSFADSSTSTAVISDGMAFVCGAKVEGASRTGTLSAIDLSKVGTAGYVPETVEVGTGASQSTPLVTKQGSTISLYVTCNATPGSLYIVRWSEGKLSAATTIFEPSGSYANYCTGSAICGSDGTIYYTNDSGYLFALKKAPVWTLQFDTQGGDVLESQEQASGEAAASVPTPQRAGYVFKGWYMDAALTEAFDPSVIGSDGETITLYAKWEKEPDSQPSPSPNPDTNQDTGQNQDAGAASKSNAKGTQSNGSGSGSQEGGAATAGASATVTAAVAADREATPDAAADEDSSAAALDSTAASTGTEDSEDDALAAPAEGTQAGLDIPAIALLCLLAAGLLIILAALKRRKQESQE